MKNRIIIAFAILFNACLAQIVCADPFESQQPTDWSGSGWLLNQGYVVTNHHVADRARTIRVKFPKADGGWNEYSAQAVAMDETNDLALLKISDEQFNTSYTLPYSVRTSLASVGESLFVLGYPLTSTMGDEIKLTTGIVSSLSGYEGSRVQYQISAPIQPGNSGGPVFDDHGNVIATVSAKHTGAENVSYAIKTSYLQTLVESLESSAGVMPTNNTLDGKSLPDKVREVSPLVCYIVCSTRGETPRSSNPRYGAPVIPEGDKVIEAPYVDNCRSAFVQVLRVTISDKQTTIELKCSSDSWAGTLQSMAISKDTYITDEETDYKLIKAEGIAILPDQTTFAYPGESKTFKLIFPAIPKGSTSISLIEPEENGWRIYGISLKEY